MGLPYLTYPFPHWWTLDCLKLPIVTKCINEHFLCCLFWNYVRIFLGYSLYIIYIIFYYIVIYYCISHIIYHVSCIIYSEAEVLGYGVRYFNLTEYYKISFQMAVSVYILESPRLPCPPWQLTFFCSFDNMLNLKWYFIAILICISLINKFEYLFIHLIIISLSLLLLWELTLHPLAWFFCWTSGPYHCC